MQSRLREIATSIFNSTSTVFTTRPEMNKDDVRVPWELDLSELTNTPRERLIGENRLIVVNQPHDVLNEGKGRSVRDVTHALGNLVMEKGLAPDFIMGLDAESVLKYNGEESPIPPLKALWNQLHRNNLIGVGTKDLFKVMDPGTGQPTNKPPGSAQTGYEATNSKKTITLPGGAMMLEPAHYIAALSTIAEEVPGTGVEDYLTTKILREEARMRGIPFEEMVKSIKSIRHINRTPENWKDAVKQMANWKKHSLAIDGIFPNDPYDQEPLQVYAWSVVKRRFEDALKQGPKHLLRLVQDFRELPQTLSFLFDNNTPDVFTQRSIPWTLQQPQSGQAKDL